jgi:hypothetical protein
MNEFLSFVPFQKKQKTKKTGRKKKKKFFTNDLNPNLTHLLIPLPLNLIHA